MVDDITPGSRVQIKVVKTPRKAAAVKTLVRILAKDDLFRAENNRIHRLRKTHNRVKQRGGRPWTVRMVKLPSARGQAGETGTITATSDVINDLRSVARFIEVAPA